ncbi:MAG: quinone-dependent dihydroorotate dehydrogenase [Rhodothermales bacterium]|nr:quinone-dependent dihydroorotate dehydrogenase [Rhodothermales bacterium]
MYSIVRPFLFSLQPELAHNIGLAAARVIPAKFSESVHKYSNAALSQYIWGIDFPNPIGLAAGLDKNAIAIPFWASLGFGFIEIGSVSAKPWAGNPKPRMFRLPSDKAVINRMGLNNQGAERIAARLRKLAKGLPPLGINIVKTPDPSIMDDDAIEDFAASFKTLVPLANYVTLNVSCPNTSEGKTFEDPLSLDRLLETIVQIRSETSRNVPILVKLSPPMFERMRFDSQVDEIVSVSLSHGVDGFIASNTSNHRDGLDTPKATLDQIGRGGLSGQPIRDRSTRLVRYIYEKAEGSVPIIGVGGIATADDAYAKVLAGASLLQLYTSLVFEGPGVVKRIKSGLAQLLLKDGFQNIKQAIGAQYSMPASGRKEAERVIALSA